MTMANRFDDIWRTAADDGGSYPLVPVACRDHEEEIGEIMDAWSRERSHSIEADIVLGRSRKVIARLIRSGVGTDADRRALRSLMRSIDQTIHPAEGEEN